MPSNNCGSFTPESGENICAINPAQDGCIEIPKVCTDMPSNNCISFTPETSTMKCDKKEGVNECETTRTCTEIAANKC